MPSLNQQKVIKIATIGNYYQKALYIMCRRQLLRDFELHISKEHLVRKQKSTTYLIQ